MPKSKRQTSRTKKLSAQPVIGRFDDALPLSLQIHTPPPSRITLHKEGGPLSPYIVRLTREQQPATQKAESIASLKAQLLAQADLLTEQTDQIDSEDTLEVDFNDLVAQFAESDREMNAPTPSLTSSDPLRPLATSPINGGDLDNPASVVHQLVDMPLDASELFENSPKTTDASLAFNVGSAPATLETPVTPATPSDHIALTFSRPTEALAESCIDTNETNEHDDLSGTIHRAPTARSFANDVPTTTTAWFHLRFPDRVAVRAFATFVFLSFAFVLPLHAMQGVRNTTAIQADVTTAGIEAMDAISKGADALQSARFDVAGSRFDQATEAFSNANTTLDHMNGLVAAVANILPQTNRTLASAQGLVTAGQELSTAASLFTKAGDDLSHQSAADLTTKLAMLSAYVTEAKPHVEAARDALKNVDASVIPDAYQEKVASLQETVPEFADSLDEFSSFANTLQTILGSNQKMRYLLAFQNNAEMRPTGGFIGSYAQIDLLHGAIVDMQVPSGGAYDVQGQLSAFVSSPAPLALVNPRWEFHDANWFPDFPTSAEKLLWFYSKAGGPTVDGVIAVNARLMPDLLAILGPIEMPEYNRVINSENFLFETEKMVEQDYVDYQDLTSDRTNPAPKQFLTDLAPKVLERAKNLETNRLLAALTRLGQGLSEKDIQIYFNDNALESQMETLGWSGSLKQTSGDSLLIVDTNLGGGKTDTVISQDVAMQVEVAEDGTITDTVTITKTHHGLATPLFEGVNNVDYVRLYVPQGSILLRAEGYNPPPESAFDISDVPLSPDADLSRVMSNLVKDNASQTDIWNESGKTVFGNWIQVAPGKTASITFTYVLPFRVSFEQTGDLLAQAKARLGFKNLTDYTLLIQKQSGVEHRTTNVTLSLPKQDRIAWSSADTDAQGVVTATNARDNFFSFLLERAP